MPKTRAYGTAQQAEAAAEEYARRVRCTIRAEAMRRDMDMLQLLARAGLNYGTFMGRLSAGRLRLSDLARINDVLKLEPAVLAELCSWGAGQ